jgi:hypothetical protein
MANQDQIKTARSMFNYANQLATMVFVKFSDQRSEQCQEMLNIRWKPAYDRAVAYAVKHNISKYDVA